MLRARKTSSSPDDATIKLRPMRREQPVESLFSQLQMQLIERRAKTLPPWAEVQVFGPIQARIWKLPASGFSGPVTVELWRLPNNRRLIEVSFKAPIDDAPEVQRRLNELLASQGLRGADDGDTKTRLAVRFFRGERAPEAESVAAASKAVELAVHAELAPEPAPAPPARPDDLALLNGIGPKIAEMLGRAGITTFTELASTSVERLRELLAAGGRRFAAADPTRWPEQAARAAEGELPG